MTFRRQMFGAHLVPRFAAGCSLNETVSRDSGAAPAECNTLPSCDAHVNVPHSSICSYKPRVHTSKATQQG
eukprot:364818-Chlamydomonas_euryale.AAC.14